MIAVRLLLYSSHSMSTDGLVSPTKQVGIDTVDDLV